MDLIRISAAKRLYFSTMPDLLKEKDTGWLERTN